MEWVEAIPGVVSSFHKNLNRGKSIFDFLLFIDLFFYFNSTDSTNQENNESTKLFFTVYTKKYIYYENKKINIYYESYLLFILLVTCDSRERPLAVSQQEQILCNIFRPIGNEQKCWDDVHTYTTVISLERIIQKRTFLNKRS